MGKKPRTESKAEPDIITLDSDEDEVVQPAVNRRSLDSDATVPMYQSANSKVSVAPPKVQKPPGETDDSLQNAVYKANMARIEAEKKAAREFNERLKKEAAKNLEGKTAEQLRDEHRRAEQEEEKLMLENQRRLEQEIREDNERLKRAKAEKAEKERLEKLRLQQATATTAAAAGTQPVKREETQEEKEARWAKERERMAQRRREEQAKWRREKAEREEKERLAKAKAAAELKEKERLEKEQEAAGRLAIEKEEAEKRQEEENKLKIKEEEAKKKVEEEKRKVEEEKKKVEEGDKRKKEDDERSERERRATEVRALEQRKELAEREEKDAAKAVENHWNLIEQFHDQQIDEQNREKEQRRKVERMREELSKQETILADMQKSLRDIEKTLKQEEDAHTEAEKLHAAKKDARSEAGRALDEHPAFAARLYSRQCPVCLVDNPRRRVTMGCGHIFCLTCAEQLEKKAKGLVGCPTCRKETTYTAMYEDVAGGATPDARQQEIPQVRQATPEVRKRRNTVEEASEKPAKRERRSRVANFAGMDD